MNRLGRAEEYAAIFDREEIDDAEEFLNDVPGLATEKVQLIKWLTTLTTGTLKEQLLIVDEVMEYLK